MNRQERVDFGSTRASSVITDYLYDRLLGNDLMTMSCLTFSETRLKVISQCKSKNLKDSAGKSGLIKGVRTRML